MQLFHTTLLLNLTALSLMYLPSVRGTSAVDLSCRVPRPIHLHNNTLGLLDLVIYWIGSNGLDFVDPALTLSATKLESFHVRLQNAFSLIRRHHPTIKLEFKIERNSSIIVTLILLAGDTELNPGPRPIKFPCLVCQKAAKWGQDCLQCDQCSGWFHIECI